MGGRCLFIAPLPSSSSISEDNKSKNCALNSYGKKYIYLATIKKTVTTNHFIPLVVDWTSFLQSLRRDRFMTKECGLEIIGILCLPDFNPTHPATNPPPHPRFVYGYAKPLPWPSLGFWFLHVTGARQWTSRLNLSRTNLHPTVSLCVTICDTPLKGRRSKCI